MKYIIEINLPDNETIKRVISKCPVHWQIWGYCGDTIAKPKEEIADTPQTSGVVLTENDMPTPTSYSTSASTADTPQTDCTEALTLLWIKNMVTDEEFYRIGARLKCISCKWWNDTIVDGSECVSKECTYEPKEGEDDDQTHDR